MNARRTKEAGEHAVSVWNASYPPGTDVILTDDLQEEHKTKTRSPAWLLGHGDPVVSVEGRTGGYLLYRIRPVNPPGD
jgi:hypothetical protein